MDKKKKQSFSKLIIGFVIAANVLFTIAVLWIFFKTASEPAVLIGAWFAFTTVEVWQLAVIKKKKIEKENETHDN
jgi:predicted membrane protein